MVNILSKMYSLFLISYCVQKLAKFILKYFLAEFFSLLRYGIRDLITI